MESWIRSLIEFAILPIRTLTNAVVSRLSALWSVIVGFYTRVRNSLGRWLTVAYGWAGAQARHALAVYVTLRWVAFDWLPRNLASTVDQLGRWVRGEISMAVGLVRGELSQLANWATRALNTVVDYLDRFGAWVSARFDAAVAAIRRLEDRVFGVLATPERLAAWAVGAIASALFRYALDQAVPVGRALWRRRVPVALESLNVVEDIVTRII